MSGEKKRPILTRGYQESRERLQKNSYYTRSCFNCEYYYQASGDKEECCQNPNVIEFDMVVTDTNVYCVNWCQCKTNSKASQIFKKNGRELLD